MIRRILVVVVLVFAATALVAQNTIPTPDEYLGYQLGDRFTSWDRIVSYFQELTRRSDLITLEKIGETYEGRPLMLAILTSPKNRANLDAIRRDIRSLAAGQPDASRASAIEHSTPAVAWLAYGVHGNESSSSEAAMRVAATLLKDPDSRALLDNLVVVIDPLENPDGRERYVQWFTRTRGAQPDANPDAFEHAEPWPGGRYNHYLIDMNRDWAWSSQAETLARIRAFQQWYPQVFVDLHEMGPNETYFFPPDAKPINMNFPHDLERWLGAFGKADSEEFSKRGWPFFVSETFDLFYPAYGDSWPALHGAVGMTYEVAGGGHGGTLYEREDSTQLKLSHRIDEHYTTSMATLRTAAAHREELLRYLYDTARAQIDGGKNVYLVPPGAPNFPSMMAMLRRSGVDITQLNAPLTAKATMIGASGSDNHTFPVGTAVITTRQPLGRLVDALLERSAAFSDAFLQEQKAKAEADEPNDFYDLTAWSLPLAMNVPAYVTAAPLAAGGAAYIDHPPATFHSASYGYLVDALDPDYYRFAGALLNAGVNFSVSEDEVSFGDHTYTRGSMVVLKGNNKPDLDATLEKIGSQSMVTIVPLESGWTGGTAMGSERFHYVRDPKIALVGGPGIGASSFGQLWHALDIETPIPHTVISVDSLRNVDLDHYRVLVLPEGDVYADRLGKRGLEKLESWIRDGGTVVAIGDASRFLRDKDVAVSKVKLWEPPKKKDDDATTTDERYNEYRIPGSAFRTTMNERSYLTFGVPHPPAVLIEGSDAYLPVAHKVDNIVTIVKDDPLVSGVAWPESLQRMKGAEYLVTEHYGRGRVVTFADQPNYRSFWRGTLPLFLNSVLYSPSFE